ncbi:diguanylate cyclase [Sphingomonas sp.]|uniref:diguanylate cyclase n=1 Tax=Sphingomonas sp. TaxID=28214 RepID=UPI0035C7A445
MRLATITNLAYGATLVLTTVSAATMLLAAHAQEGERAAVAQRYRLDKATSEVAKDCFALTERARLYVMSGDPTQATAYRSEAAALGNVEARLRGMVDLGASPAEIRALKTALDSADTLRDEQASAITARLAGRGGEAVRILFGPEYQRQLERVDNAVTQFQDRLDQRTADEVKEAEAFARTWRTVSEVVLALTGLLFLCVLYFVFKQRVLRPVVRLSDVVARLAAQDYAVEPPPLGQIDEIGDMAQAIRIFRENGLERQRLEEERAKDRLLRDQLARMTNRLQGCDTFDDLQHVIHCFVPDLLPGTAGALYLFEPSRKVMAELFRWGGALRSTAEFPPLSCWALRRGSAHRLAADERDVPCAHLHAGESGAALCLPLIVQREAVGLLYLEPCGELADFQAATDVFLPMLSENIGLAIGNLQLRVSLREMANADALTGLANRRYLDEVFELEVARALDNGLPLSCLMLDVDHFKSFNDRFGHDAGDRVLRTVGQVLRAAARDEGLAFRYGGEEFALLMPGYDQPRAERLAEAIRQRMANLDLSYDGVALGPITVSIGVAVTPDHCPPEKLIVTADTALLRAKQDGRDRCVVAQARGGLEAAA